jgi:hypothetical protein
VQAPKRQRVDKIELYNRWEADKRSERDVGSALLERGGV